MRPLVLLLLLWLAGPLAVCRGQATWHHDTQNEVLRGRTDDQGRYRFDRVAPGPMRLQIEPDRAPAPSWLLRVDLEPGEIFTHDVKLEAGVRLFGRVNQRSRPADRRGTHR